MKPSNIPLLRLANQKLISHEFNSPRAVVSWMGAMQAQDYPMAKWAIGTRLPGTKDAIIEAAFNNGDLLRTHLLRPTWHFVTPEDIYWLLELTAPQIKASERARERDLELTPEIYAKSNAIIEKMLVLRGQSTREELMVELQQAGIATDQNRASHLFMQAELDQIVCSGATRRGKPAYALLSERVPKPRRLSRDEALAELARRYFDSRYPATMRDFTWWSGLPAAEAKKAMELVSSEFETVRIGEQTYWIARHSHTVRHGPPIIHLLPTYDEYILSYVDRSAAIAAELEQHMKEISDRGIFWPIILVNGRVIGTWKRTLKKEKLIIETRFFSSPAPATFGLVEQAAARYATFLGQQLVINTN